MSELDYDSGSEGAGFGFLVQKHNICNGTRNTALTSSYDHSPVLRA